MEFEEMQQVWDNQGAQPQYVINEKALHAIILSKKKQASHRINVSELALIIVYICAGAFILCINAFGPPHFISLDLMAGWITVTGLLVLFSRIRRIRESLRFDRSIHGDLDHAISAATYQVRMSRLTRWNILPVGILILLGVWEGGKSVWVGVGTVLLFVFAYFVGGMENKVYKNRRSELDVLKKKLEG